MGTLLRHGSEEQKRAYLPRIARGELRLQSMAVTEPTTGTDTTKTATFAVKHGDRYVVNGQKVWLSRAHHSDLLVLLARTSPYTASARTAGMSLFLVDIKAALDNGLTLRPIRNMVNHETSEAFFTDLEIPAANLIGEEGKGFRYILDGLNAERDRLRQRARRLRPADRAQPGRAVSDRRVPHRDRSRRLDAMEGVQAVRQPRAVRRRGEHGEVPRGESVVGSRERVSSNTRRLWLRGGIRRRA
jgi:hypothetical protein